MCICIITWICSCPLFFFFLPQCLSYGSFNSFKNFYIHSYIESTSTIFTFLTSFFYPPSLLCGLPFLWPVKATFSYWILFLWQRWRMVYEEEHEMLCWDS
jgi:hypothetical protein